MKTPKKPEPDFDFGFSFMDEDIEQLTQANADVTSKSDDIARRLNKLHEAIIPFLDNLCKNPEKSTILWPNRVEKIQGFKEKLQSIVEGTDT